MGLIDKEKSAHSARMDYAYMRFYTAEVAHLSARREQPLFDRVWTTVMETRLRLVPANPGTRVNSAL
jgi:hypothetical protein